MRAMKFVIPMLILAMFALTGCGKMSAADGAKKMKDVIVDLKKNIEADDAAKVKQNAKDLEDNWAKFEDGVKETNPDAYKQVEDPLGLIETGAGKAPLDKAILIKAADDLNTALDLIK
jgi:iron uptake system EfeUOB component EfeO/EfeM